MSGKKYRQAKKGNKHDWWCWFSDCSFWPETDYNDQDEKPAVNKCCDECRDKEESDTSWATL